MHDIIKYQNVGTTHDVKLNNEIIKLDMLGVWYLARHLNLSYYNKHNTYKIINSELYIYDNMKQDPFIRDIQNIIENAKYSEMEIQLVESPSGRGFYDLIVQNHVYKGTLYQGMYEVDFKIFLDLLEIPYERKVVKDKSGVHKFIYNLKLGDNLKPELLDNDIGIHLYNSRVKSKFIDFRFVCNNVGFNVHKLVISSIPFFEEHIDNKEFVFPNGYNCSSIKILIKYIYLGSKTWYEVHTDLSLETIEELLNLSDFLEMQDFFNLLSYILYDKFVSYRSILRKYEMTQDNNEYFHKLMNTFKDESQYLMYLSETFIDSLNLPDTFTDKLEVLEPTPITERFVYNDTYKTNNLIFRYSFIEAFHGKEVEIDIVDRRLFFKIFDKDNESQYKIVGNWLKKIFMSGDSPKVGYVGPRK